MSPGADDIATRLQCLGRALVGHKPTVVILRETFDHGF